MHNSWINRFKIALVEEDIEELEIFQKDIPTFSTLRELEEAQALMLSAIKLLKTKKDSLNSELSNLTPNISNPYTLINSRINLSG